MWRGCKSCKINKRGGWNNRGGWNFFEKSINVEGGFLRGGWIFFSKNHLNLYFQTKKGSNFLNQLHYFLNQLQIS